MSDASFHTDSATSGRASIWNALSRVTSSGKFIPLIDGLRFVAISAVYFYHLNDYLVHKREWTRNPEVTGSLLYQTLNVGGCGVPLFFAISGFILALPFLEHIQERKPFQLKNYFLRRLTRLEPPYIINLLLITGLLVAFKGESLQSLLAPLIASIFYVHGLIYQEGSRINFVAWSLEIEVQYYLLAPFLALALYRLPRLYRRIILTTAILGTCLFKSWSAASGNVVTGGLTLLHTYEHFLVGMLLADIYHSDWQRSPHGSVFHDFLGLGAWCSVIAVNWSPVTRPFLPLATLAAYHSTFRSITLARLLSLPFVTTIGGMCYTLYLYHFFIISFGGRFALNLVSAYAYPVQFLLLTLLITPVVLLASGLLFVTIERPFMIWKPFLSTPAGATVNPGSKISQASVEVG